ncbi:hypothetical protein MEM_02000 [Candida albicans L26]|nr:hypothetical protein MEO_01988 [Candida albicans P94015]KGR20937.1 hypothetical protein MG9_02004 [Candida albicans P37037]KGT70774.1 hypothetical protein MEK_02018 [Candida albicans 12C]KGU15381.1 hypothetical protein MEM_02000 [Candida albicans L26]KGU28660.1 hypothetical protein MG7_02006 [Candida albicans P34048]KGU35178.1 hypothetical protein MGK_01992 [Candida albicans P57055]KHC53672.1 hypothetical protein MEW_01940 [Candida albicans P60002]KHC80385.1 hypothetical protein MGS_01986
MSRFTFQRSLVYLHSHRSISNRLFLDKRLFSTKETTTNKEPDINPHTVFYKQFSKPFTKICLISIGTYYSLIYLWEFLDKSEASEPIQ